jgi:uncharacterized membrane protein YidH (DUF202 family)
MTNSELMDVGAQAERTALAWQRTGIGVMAAGALLMRWNVEQHVPAWPGVLLTVVAGLAILVLVPHRYHRILRTVRAGHTPLSRGMVPGAMLLVMVLALGIAAGIGAELLRG